MPARLVERLGVTIDLNKYPYQMSGGQQQLVSIMRSLEREFMALPQCAPSHAPRVQQPAISMRSIEHVSTGSRRRPDAPGRPFSRQSMRGPNRGALSAKERP